MKKNLFFRLFLLIAFGISLHSCMHDDVSSSTDPASKGYTNKSLWEEDEKYIGNVMKIFEEHADKEYFANNFGVVSWDHALTMGNFDESFLEAPVVKNGKINFILLAIREGDRVYFKRKDEQSSKDFFNILVFTDRERNRLTGRVVQNSGAASKTGICYTVETTVTWTNDDGSAGPTYSSSETHCVSTGPSLPCQAIEEGADCGGPSTGGSGGSGGGGYGYPPADGATQQLLDNCARLKTQTSNSTFKSNITNLEGKTGDSYESGFRIGTNANGTLQNQILQNKPGTQEVDIKAFSNTITLMHSHYDGLYPMFSPGDILFFNQWVVWAQNWNSIATNTPKIPLNKLTFTLVTSWGNYSFTFDGTSTTPFPNYTAQELDNLNRDYMDNLNKATK